MIARSYRPLRSTLGLVLLLVCQLYPLTLALASSVPSDLSMKTPSTDISGASAMQTDAAAYHEFASAAVDVSDAHVSKDGLLTVIRSVRDIDTNKRRRFLYSIPLPDPSNNGPKIPFIPPSELHDSIKMRLPSPSGDKIAILREEVVGTSPGKQVLEVWTNGGQALLRRILLPAKFHGKVINDFGGFGKPAWNPTETALVYAAERNNRETVSFFADPGKAAADGEPPVVRGGTNTLGLGKSENWGEKYSKQSPLFHLFCVNVETGNVGQIENVPGQQAAKTDSLGGFTLGQAVFSPKGKSIAYTAWDAGGGSEMPRRLGLIYCQQRSSQVYASSIAKLLKRLASKSESINDNEEEEEEEEQDDACVNLTPGYRLARSPRFSPPAKGGSSKMVFLASKKGFDTHQGCLALHAVEWTNDKPSPGTPKVILDQVWDPKDNSLHGGEFDALRFPGLFLQQLSESCFLSSDYLVTTTQWGSRQKVVRVSLNDGTASAMDAGESHFSDELLCLTPGGGLILSLKSPNVPNTVHYIPEVTDSSSDDILLSGMSPIASTRFTAIPNGLTFDFTCSIETLDNPPSIDGVDAEIPVQSVLLLPDKKKYPKPPVIVVPHGGPHSCSSAIYMPSYAYLCNHGGYAILLVNYRGSTGFGQASIEALPTRIGDADVKDVVAATLKLKESGLVDPDRIGICGGSHGGFLTGHCTGQHPDLFKAAAMRNPVVNLPSMVTPTDIPDWCYVEVFGKYKWDEYRPPTREALNVMWDKSPIRYIEQVKTPTLVALGLSDLRVPPSQGLEWYHALRSKGVATKLLVYEEDDHAIAGVVSEADHWVNIKRWFDEHL